MRRRLLFLAAAATPALLAACFGAGQVIVTVGTEGGVDATSDVASESASDGNGGAEDAVAEVGSATEAGGEAGTDAPVGEGGPDAAPTTVTVKLTVFATGPNPVAEPGVVVFFSGADGSLISQAVSDTSGQVTASVPAGSMVTAAFGGPGHWWPTTVLGIQPGDVIGMLDQSGPLGPSLPLYSGDFTALPPAMLPDGGEVTAYTVNTPCNGAQLGTDGGLPAPFTDCNWGPLYPSIVWGSVMDDAGNPQTVSFAGSKALAAPTDGGALSISLDLPWQSPVTSTVTVINGNANQNTTTAAVYDIVDNWSFGLPSVSSSDLDGGAVEHTFQNYPGFPDFVQAETDQDVNGTGNSYVIGAIGTKGGNIPPATTLDVSQFLPAILVGGVDSQTDPMRPVATWSPVGPLASAAGTEAQLMNKPQTLFWSFFAPPDVTRIQVPVLPADLMTPPDGGADGGAGTDLALDLGNAPYSLFVQTVKFDAVKGYAEFRQTAGNLALVNLYNWGAAAPEPLPAAGTYYATYFQNLP
jgi:hypothetical protein